MTDMSTLRKANDLEDLYNQIAADNDVERFRFLSDYERRLLLEAIDALIESLTKE